ncbi:MAG: transporter substrate-binding domain-containing protein [Clostridiales bacterium]|nr:transporter substrate-binding domain-containing protein [Clostridiales bacterium]
MRKILLIIMTLIIFVIPLSACQSTASNELVIGMELAYPPFEMTDADDNPDGFSVKLAEAIGKELGRPIRIEAMAWTGLIPAITSGKVDFVLSSMTITDDRAEIVNFSNPYAKSQLSLLISKESTVQNFNDLKAEGKKIAVKGGTTGHIYATKNLPEENIIVFDKAEIAVLEVSQGKVDAFIYDALTIYQNSLQYESTTRASFEIFQDSFEFWGMAFDKSNTQLLSDVNATLIKLQENGKVNEIADTYLGDIKKVFETQGLSFFFDID